MINSMILDLNKNGYFFMDGYYAERGENPSLTARLG